MTVKANKVSTFAELKIPGDLFWHESPTIKQGIYVCPCGCGSIHSFIVKGIKEPIWTWNGDESKPTITPSLHHLAGCTCGWHGTLTDGVFCS